eukprot:tig00000093_g3503.t1
MATVDQKDAMGPADPCSQPGGEIDIRAVDPDTPSGSGPKPLLSESAEARAPSSGSAVKAPREAEGSPIASTTAHDHESPQQPPSSSEPSPSQSQRTKSQASVPRPKISVNLKQKASERGEVASPLIASASKKLRYAEAQSPKSAAPAALQLASGTPEKAAAAHAGSTSALNSSVSGEGAAAGVKCEAANEESCVTVFCLLLPSAAKELGGTFHVDLLKKGNQVLHQLPLSHVNSTLWASRPACFKLRGKAEIKQQYRYVYTPSAVKGKPAADPVVERGVRTLLPKTFQFDMFFDHPKKELNVLAVAGPQHPFELYLQLLVHSAVADLRKLGGHVKNPDLTSEPESTLPSRFYELLFEQVGPILGQKWIPPVNNFLRLESSAFLKHKTPPSFGGALLLAQLFLELSDRETLIVKGSMSALLSAVTSSESSNADPVSWMRILLSICGSSSNFDAALKSAITSAVLQSATQRPADPPAPSEAEKMHEQFVDSAQRLIPTLASFAAEQLDTVCHALLMTAPGLGTLVKILVAWWPAIAIAAQLSAAEQEDFLEKMQTRMRKRMSSGGIPGLRFAFHSSPQAGAAAVALWGDVPDPLRALLRPVFQWNVAELARSIQSKKERSSIQSGALSALLCVLKEPACESFVAETELCKAVEVLVEKGEATVLRAELPPILKRAFSRVEGVSDVTAVLLNQAKLFLRRCFNVASSADKSIGPLGAFQALSSLPPAVAQDENLLKDLWDSCTTGTKDIDILRAIGRARGQKWCKEARQQILVGCTHILAEAAASQDLAHEAVAALDVSTEPDSLCDELLVILLDSVSSFDFRGENTVQAVLRARKFWVPILAIRRTPLSQVRQLQQIKTILNTLYNDLSERTITVWTLLHICEMCGPDAVRECLSAVGFEAGRAMLEDSVASVRSAEENLQRLVSLCTVWQSLALPESHKASLDTLAESLQQEHANLRQQSLAQLSTADLHRFGSLSSTLDAIGPHAMNLLKSSLFRTFLQPPAADSPDALADLLPQLTLSAVDAFNFFLKRMFQNVTGMPVAEIVRHWDFVSLQRRSEGETMQERIEEELAVVGVNAKAVDVEELAGRIKQCLEAQALEELAPHITACAARFGCVPSKEEQPVLGRWSSNPLANATVREAIEARRAWNRTLGSPDEDVGAVLRELGDEDGDGRKLLEFLRKVGPEHEALQHLKDAADEQSDMQFRTTTDTVQDLANVRSFLHPILYGEEAKKHKASVANLLGYFNTRMKLKSSISIANNIATCCEQIEALTRLYEGVANRGEVTKGIVRDALRHGKYVFTCDDAGARLVLEIKDEDGDRLESLDASYSYEEVQDVRSRAIVIRSSRIRAAAPALEPEAEAAVTAGDLSIEELDTFIDDSTLAGDALGVLMELHTAADSRYNNCDWSHTASGSEQRSHGGGPHQLRDLPATIFNKHIFSITNLSHKITNSH